MDYKQEDIEEKMIDGAIAAIQEKTNQLKPLLKDLTNNELKRIILNVATFPAACSPNEGKEIEATQVIYAIKKLQTDVAVMTIGQIQKEKELQGDSNE